MDSLHPTIKDLHGLWRRSLLAQPNGERDVTTRVLWLQGDAAFVDLRRPALLPDMRDKRGLDDLTLDDCHELAQQAGFAGQLTFDGAHFEWVRLIDFQPKSRHADAASLRWEGSVLIEEGRDVGYLEHWQRNGSPRAAPTAAVTLRSDSGVKGLLLRVGADFMFARDRAMGLPPYITLTACVAGASSLESARSIMDCEVSFGTVRDDGFLIAASTLPYRVGDLLEPREAGTTLTTADRAADGSPTVRNWEITACEGDLRTLAIDRRSATHSSDAHGK